ncbi:probable inactive receptor kinase At2g26730 [Pyrus communis]|uniref:probable inactive receptor kinase At2g26730 n=1 Tax=Pyrus communis TaxID=23211 RepID=UPI0035C116FE
MDRISIWALAILIILVIFPMADSEDQEWTQIKQALVQFMDKLSPANAASRDGNWGWNMSSDPCIDKWEGVTCDRKNSVKKIVLETSNLTGVLDANSLCMVKSVGVVSLKNNNITGLLSEDIGNCRDLTHLYISGNHFSGELPESLSHLNNLKRVDISSNNFSGVLPDFAKISGLISFLAQNNRLDGQIPDFHFFNLKEFNVSNNDFSGPIPDVNGQFGKDSFLGNPKLCGKPLQNECPPAIPTPVMPKKSKKSSSKKLLLFSGCIVLGLVVVCFFLFKLAIKKIREDKEKGRNKKIAANDAASTVPSNTISSGELMAGGGHKMAEYSLSSVESGMAPPLVVLTSPLLRGLSFEELLRAPAELLVRGKNGSLYKIMLDRGLNLVVKRIRNSGISREKFKTRLTQIDQVKCRNVLPAVAFYCSRQEKLLVYEYQPNGSLFNLLHESSNGQIFDWGSRLSVAEIIAESLAFMHQELHEHGIAHGNLKSKNILFNTSMEPCISEYGIMEIENQDQSHLSPNSGIESSNAGHAGSTFKGDVYGFGVILLELLTGKLVQQNGLDLPRWVHSVVSEEWTVEVFDGALIQEGASEERMVKLLQVAMRCINERPSMSRVSAMIKSIKEEEERSVSSDP